MGIPREQAAAIAQDLNRDIFSPIKDVLKEWNAEIAQTTPSAALPEEVAAPAEAPKSEVRANPQSPIIPASLNATPPPISVVVPAGASHPITFSMHKALGKAGVEEPSSAGTLANKGEAGGNILEQKLGGTFRMKSNAVHYAVPHKPKIPAASPRRIPQASSANPSVQSGDPYREAAI
jgi:hypothetical protein